MLVWFFEAGLWPVFCELIHAFIHSFSRPGWSTYYVPALCWVLGIQSWTGHTPSLGV